MTNDRALPFRAVALAHSGGELPRWVQLSPPGSAWTARDRDGRQFAVTDPQAILDDFRAEHPGGMQVDYEHASEDAARRGQDTPAAGWVHEIELRDGAFWARVEWTDRAAAMIRAKEFRFLSPVMWIAGDRVTGFKAAGLTNYPAFHKMAAVARAEDKETPSLEDAIREALGLATGASTADAVVAIQKLKDERTTAQARAQDTTLFVPVATHQAQIEAARAEEREKLAKARAEEAADAAVDAAIEGGKIAPADRAFYAAAARADVASFTAAMDRAPQIAGGSGLDAKEIKRTPGSAGAVTETARAICAQLGMDEAAFAEARVAEETAQ